MNNKGIKEFENFPNTKWLQNMEMVLNFPSFNSLHLVNTLTLIKTYATMIRRLLRIITLALPFPDLDLAAALVAELSLPFLPLEDIFGECKSSEVFFE